MRHRPHPHQPNAHRAPPHARRPLPGPVPALGAPQRAPRRPDRRQRRAARLHGGQRAAAARHGHHGRQALAGDGARARAGPHGQAARARPHAGLRRRARQDPACAARPCRHLAGAALPPLCRPRDPDCRTAARCGKRAARLPAHRQDLDLPPWLGRLGPAMRRTWTHRRRRRTRALRSGTTQHVRCRTSASRRRLWRRAASRRADPSCTRRRRTPST